LWETKGHPGREKFLEKWGGRRSAHVLEGGGKSRQRRKGVGGKCKGEGTLTRKSPWRLGKFV